MYRSHPEDGNLSPVERLSELASLKYAIYAPFLRTGPYGEYSNEKKRLTLWLYSPFEKSTGQTGRISRIVYLHKQLNERYLTIGAGCWPPGEQERTPGLQGLQDPYRRVDEFTLGKDGEPEPDPMLCAELAEWIIEATIHPGQPIEARSVPDWGMRISAYWRGRIEWDQLGVQSEFMYSVLRSSLIAAQLESA
jgi:hypothetical protein